jgi:hypothetical protein
MEPVQTTWKFTRTSRPAGPAAVIRLDALHALQSWRIGSPGRAYRLIRSSPFQWTDQLQARLTHQTSDLDAETDLAEWCTRHCVSASALVSAWAA